jgi:hypothetical protein
MGRVTIPYRPTRRIARYTGWGLFWFDPIVSELLLQLQHIDLQGVILMLEGLGVATLYGAACNAVGRLAFGVVLEARRTATRSRIASDLAYLWQRTSADICIRPAANAARSARVASNTPYTDRKPVQCATQHQASYADCLQQRVQQWVPDMHEWGGQQRTLRIVVHTFRRHRQTGDSTEVS